MENASKEFTAKAVKDLIEHQESKYSWDFMFVGADKKCVDVAVKDLGFKVAQAAFYDINKTNDTYNLLSNKVATYRSCNIVDVEKTLAFSAEEKAHLE
jgi:uncharacterized protein (UPF0179 family)